jgi:hypothetical protein
MEQSLSWEASSRLQRLQQSAIDPYTDPDESSPYIPTLFPRVFSSLQVKLHTFQKSITT